jgi:hypothetical protein
MLNRRLVAGCAGALALGLSAANALAIPAAPLSPADTAAVTRVRFGGAGFHAGGFSGFHGSGFHGGGFRAGYGFHRGHIRGFRSFGYAPLYGYGYGNDCWWSPRRHRWVCAGY